jgi:hypothetical protein
MSCIQRGMISPARLKSLLLVAAVGVGCSTPNEHREPCGECPSGTFCCVSICQPFGTVCGAVDAAEAGSDAVAETTVDGELDINTPVDATSDVAPSDPCALHGGATSVSSACAASIGTGTMSGPGVVMCASRSEIGCGPHGNCVEWLDSMGVLHGVCADPGQTSASVCNPAHDSMDCMGSLQRVCVAANPGQPGEPPQGWWGTSDCRVRWATDAVCRVGSDGIAVCSSPTDVPCNPDTFARSCNQYCLTAPGVAMGGVVRPICSGAMSQCVNNTSTGGMPSCIPGSAVPSAHPATSAVVGLACDPSGGIRNEQYGYEWVEACGLEYMISGGMAGRR